MTTLHDHLDIASQAKPSNAITWMIQYLIKRAGPQSDTNVSIATGSDVTVCLSSSTLMKQETINESKLAPILQRLASSAVIEAPTQDTVLSFITTTAHNLQKENPELK